MNLDGNFENALDFCDLKAMKVYFLLFKSKGNNKLSSVGKQLKIRIWEDFNE